MSRSLRVACVQLSPCFKDPARSRERADALIALMEPNTLDLLVLPEMAFTGALLPLTPPPPRLDVAPFVEVAESGETRDWAARTARGLNCYVLVGLPTVPRDAPTDEAPPPYYNSLLVVSPSGALVGVYHKHHLYGTLTNAHADYLWATPGSAFVALDLPFPSSSPGGGAGEGFRLVPGICMDLNERDFAPTTEYALASFARDERADVLVVAMSWLDSEPPLEGQGGAKEAEGGKDKWEEVRDVISYWVVRSMPLLGSGAALVAANRVGREGDTVFTGSSCVVELGDRPAVAQFANKRGEAVILAEVELPKRD
ncbi:carbon-nitrogen hydrolase [Rhodotorula diobovata]|uniref:Carbon-nitrogen hydrolase n=1 Tax=Rhodotorula diobovata TaxID=5288 RepID=A0A5C5G0S9_9BASI|nr:carbon-nitrogen hydrolase [Rhodotorula diobovata]